MAEELAIPDAEAVETPKPKGKALKFVLLLLIVGGIAAGGWTIVRARAGKTQAPPEDKVVSVLHLDNFVVNLADTDSRSFLRIGIDLGLTHVVAGEKEAVPIAVVRDTIFSVLSVWKSEDLLTIEGKNKLKETLVQTLKDRAPELGVREVYFTEFLVQR